MIKTSNKLLKRLLTIMLSVFLLNLQSLSAKALPEDFVYVADIVQNVILEPRYFSTYNFVGERIDGYNSANIIMTKKAAEALKKASDELENQGYILKIGDAYRPQTAVDHFVRWAKDILDVKMKEYFYPNVDKSKLIELDYISERSGHTRGSTVDLTIVDKTTGLEVDMGSHFDLFDEISHHGTKLISEEQAENRNILKTAMENAGFKADDAEW